MKNLKMDISQLTKILLLFTLTSLLTTGCGSTDSNNEEPPEEEQPSTNFDSGSVAADGTFSYTFENAGAFEYFCEFHVSSGMEGEVTVSSDAESTESDTVRMEGMEFVPAQITIAPGTEVVWINVSDLDHTVTSGNPSDDGDGDPRY